MKIKLITILEYSALSKNDKVIYDMVLDSIQTSGKVIRVKFLKEFIEIKPKHDDLWDLSFADMIDLKTAFENDDADLIKSLSKIVYRTNLDNVCLFDLPVFNWIIDDMAKLLEVEKAELDYNPTPEAKAAGIDELKRFGYLPMIKAITGDDITKEKEILREPYHKIFTELAYQKTISDIKLKLYAGK